MKAFSENFTKYFWFIGGFALGIMLISLSHAALPKRVTPQTNTQRSQNSSIVSEMKGGKVNSPEFDQDLANLNAAEGRYAESLDQQNRLKTATARVARVSVPVQKKKRSQQN